MWLCMGRPRYAWNGKPLRGIHPFTSAASGSPSPAPGWASGRDAVIDSAASVALIWRFHVETRQPERAAHVEHIAERVVGAALVALAVYLVVGSRALARNRIQKVPGGVVLLGASRGCAAAAGTGQEPTAKQLGRGLRATAS